MRLGLCLFFNYPFPKNFAVLRKLYEDYFDEVRFIQPMVMSPDKDSFTVYRAAFNFSGFFSDARHFLAGMNCDAIVFAGDDCLINREVVGRQFLGTFGTPSKDFDIFTTRLLPFSGENWWMNTQKVRALGRIFGNSGFFDQHINEWRNYFPSYDWMEARLQHYNILNEPLKAPSSDQLLKLPKDHAFILEGFFQGKTSRAIPYPLTYGISDFFIVTSTALERFCHYAGLFATLNIFSEFSTPTAMIASNYQISQVFDVGKKVDWSFGNNQAVEHFVPRSYREVTDYLTSMGEDLLYKHPVKLSGVSI
jgi:hypothetical protein